MESPPTSVATNKRAKDARNNSRSLSSSRRLEAITRRAAQNHVDSAWVAYQRLIRRCLVLKFGKQTDDQEGQRVGHGDHDVSVKSECNNGCHAPNEGQKSQPRSQLEPGDSAHEIDTASSKNTQEEEKRAESNGMLSSVQNESEYGGPREQGRKRRKPTVAEQSTRNIIMQHFVGMHNKKRNTSTK